MANQLTFSFFLFFTFYNDFTFIRLSVELCLTLSKQALVFTCLQYKPFENTAAKGEVARNKPFLLFSTCFLPIRRTFFLFHQT